MPIIIIMMIMMMRMVMIMIMMMHSGIAEIVHEIVLLHLVYYLLLPRQKISPAVHLYVFSPTA